MISPLHQWLQVSVLSLSLTRWAFIKCHPSHSTRSPLEVTRDGTEVWKHQATHSWCMSAPYLLFTHDIIGLRWAKPLSQLLTVNCRWLQFLLTLWYDFFLGQWDHSKHLTSRNHPFLYSLLGCFSLSIFVLFLSFHRCPFSLCPSLSFQHWNIGCFWLISKSITHLYRQYKTINK